MLCFFPRRPHQGISFSLVKSRSRLALLQRASWLGGELVVSCLCQAEVSSVVPVAAIHVGRHLCDVALMLAFLLNSRSAFRSYKAKRFQPFSDPSERVVGSIPFKTKDRTHLGDCNGW